MRVDAVHRRGLSPLQKCTTAIRILAYGSPADSVNDYVRIGESTTLECLDRFVTGVCIIFGAEYLRRPNNKDIVHLLQMGKARNFSGSNNDINVLNQSDVFADVLNREAPTVQYTVNRTLYHMRYYLVNGIYPEWATFVKTISMSQGEKRKLFAKRQESARKDVERTFGVLQSRFAIIRGPTRAWHVNKMKHIMYGCTILHNMIVEDERDTYMGNFDYDQVDNDISTTEVHNGILPNFTNFFERRAHVHQKPIHRQLQADLMEHIWERFGHENNEN